MNKQELTDNENPEWTDEMFQNATSLEDSDLPEDFKRAVLGRPKKEHIKIPISIRLSSEVLDYYKQSGKGWQSRIDHDLMKNISRHSV